MASGKEYLHFILEQLSDLDDISYRPMMGEFILYYHGKIVGGIYDDRLLVKKTRSALELMPAAICELPYEGAKEMLLVDEVDSKVFLTELFIGGITDELYAAEVLHTFDLTHTETEYLLTYPEENSFTVQEEAKFLKARSESKNAIEIAAFVDARIAGTAGIDPIDDKEKIRHRADFGIAIEKAYWGRGIGKALTLACIECAKQAGYLQIELEVVAENASAVRLYESVGFQEYGRNPRGFRARRGWQTLVLMRLELDS